MTVMIAPGLQAPLVAHPAETVKVMKTWTALASWYGPHFQGRETADGEPYDMFGATAAHLWLPFGSMLRVTNPRNGHTLVVRVNDRGPFIDARELDVSFLVASRLGMVEKGVERVRIELLQEPPHPSPAKPQPAAN